MKNRRTLIVSALVLLLSGVAVLSYVKARPYFRQYPQPHPLCLVDADVALSNGAQLRSNGTMQMEITGNSDPDATVAFQTLRPVSFNSSGDDPQLGHVVWSLDHSRQLPESMASRIQSNNPDDLFPATSDIYFYVKATASAYPGVEFRSATPVHMRATDLHSFNPHVNELYHAQAPIDFTNESGEVAFTVTSLSSTLN